MNRGKPDQFKAVKLASNLAPKFNGGSVALQNSRLQASIENPAFGTNE